MSGVVGSHKGSADGSHKGSADGAAYTSRGSASATPSTVSASLVKGEARDLDPTPGYVFRPYVYGGSRSRFAIEALKRMPAIPPGQ